MCQCLVRCCLTRRQAVAVAAVVSAAELTGHVFVLVAAAAAGLVAADLASIEPEWSDSASSCTCTESSWCSHRCCHCSKWRWPMWC